MSPKRRMYMPCIAVHAVQPRRDQGAAKTQPQHAVLTGHACEARTCTRHTYLLHRLSVPMLCLTRRGRGDDEDEPPPSHRLLFTRGRRNRGGAAPNHLTS